MPTQSLVYLKMFSSIYFAILLLGASLVTGAPHRRDIARRRGCGTHITSAAIASAERLFQTNRLPPPDENSTATATLDIHFHVVYANETLDGGFVPDEQIRAQVDVMNRDYNITGVSWNLVTISRILSPDWFAKVAPDTPEEADLKSQYRKGNASALNVYTVGLKEGPGQGLLGYATFPKDYSGKPSNDGVVILYSTMPGGPTPPYNMGRTLTHESGHWSGLYHTFEGGCTGKGDHVDDTPPEKEAAYGCIKTRRTCPKSKIDDPTTNFMDYSDDACMTGGFTKGQGTRIRAQLRTYRDVAV